MLVLPRLYLGTIFAVSAFTKITSPNFAATLVGFLNAMAMNSGFPWYRSFLASIVIPHAGVFATLVTAGETYVAVAMLLGVTTRVAAGVAILLLANYLCAKGMLPWMPASNDAADIVLSIVVMAGAAGRTYGVDRWLHERFPNVAAF